MIEAERYLFIFSLRESRRTPEERIGGSTCQLLYPKRLPLALARSTAFVDATLAGAQSVELTTTALQVENPVVEVTKGATGHHSQTPFDYARQTSMTVRSVTGRT